MRTDALVHSLRNLGKVRGSQWTSTDPHVYFDHSGGKVSLRQASHFYNHALDLAKKAADALETK